MVFVLGEGGFFLLAEFAENLSSLFAYMFHVIAILGGGIVGFMIKEKFTANLFVYSVLATIALLLLNVAAEYVGFKSDFSGSRGATILLAFSTPFIFLLSYLGGAIGHEINERRNAN